MKAIIRVKSILNKCTAGRGKFFMAVALLFSAPNLWAHSIEKISGEVFLDLDSGKIAQTLFITNVWNNSPDITFLLHKYFEIDSLQLNGKAIGFQRDSLKTHFLSSIYLLQDVQGISPEYTLAFFISGAFPVVNENTERYTFRSDHDILTSYSVFRANGLSAWHPVLFEETQIPVSEFLKTKKADYSLRLQCMEEHTIVAGSGIPSKSVFLLSGVQNLPLIIAGDFEWNILGNMLFVNLDSIQQRAIYEETHRVISYYEGLLGIPFDSDPVFARVEMDFGLDKEFAFYAYPVTVFVNKKGHTDVWQNMMISHELAHYYFGNVLVPASELYWFFSESVTEYFSLKYLVRTNNTSKLKEKYQTLFILNEMSGNMFRKRNTGDYDIRFVKLASVTNPSEVHEVQRYIYSPFQLLGMEHEIGEENMMEFVRRVYPALSNQEDGYTAIVTTLRNMGIDRKTIKRIERKYFIRWSLKHYRFVESLLSA